MRSFTFLLSFLLFVSSANASTLVLKNGRRCRGDLISDAGPTIQFRDADTGVMLSLKKDQLDADATAAANAPRQDPVSGSETHSAAAAASEAPNLALLAAELRAQRTGRARVYTTADLTRTPEVSVSGNTAPAAELDVPREPDAPDEKRWRSEARTLRKELESAQDHAAAAEAACDRARRSNRTAIQSLHRHPVELPPLTQQPSECRRMEEMNRRLSEAQDRFEDFEERARRAGVPWQWLE